MNVVNPLRIHSCISPIAQRTCRRSYAYIPRAHSISLPKPNRQIDSVPNDPTLFHKFLKSFANLQDTKQMPDSLAMQIFTHKSFSHGKLGYNEKLAFLGRRVLYMRISEYLFHASRTPDDASVLERLDAANISTERLEHLVSLDTLGLVAMKQDGLESLLRWKPKDTADPQGSGVKKIAAEALMAIVGALELQYGAVKASEVVLEKVIHGIDQYVARIAPSKEPVESEASL